MVAKHAEELYKIYDEKSNGNRYCFTTKSRLAIFYLIVIAIITIGVITITQFSSSHMLKYLFVAILCLMSIIAIILYYFFLENKMIKAEYQKLYENKSKNDSYGYVRLIAMYYFQEYIKNNNIETEEKIKAIISYLKNRAEQVGIKEIKVFGALAFIMLPFWSSYVDRLIDSVKIDEEVNQLFGIIGLFILFFFALYIIYAMFNESILDVVNGRSKKYRQVATILEEDFLLPLIETQGSQNDRVLKTLFNIEKTLKGIYRQNKNMRVRH